MIALDTLVHIVRSPDDALYSEFSPRDVEVEAVCHGLKPALRTLIDDRHEASFCSRLEARGLLVKRSSYRVKDEDRLLRRSSNGKRIVYASRSASLLEKLASGDADDPFERADEVGKILGYPDCCVDSFVRTPPSSHSEVILQTQARSRAFAHSLNVLDSRLALISHYPCHFSCAPSRRYAEGLLSVLDHGRPGLADRLSRFLTGPFHYFHRENAYLRIGQGPPGREGLPAFILCASGSRPDLAGTASANLVEQVVRWAGLGTHRPEPPPWIDSGRGVPFTFS